MDKVQATNPGAPRPQATVEAAKSSVREGVTRPKDEALLTPTTETISGKPLPVSATQRPEAAATSDRQQLEDAADKVNEYAKQQKREVRFSVDQELGLPVVKVVDSSRDVVVRQIPSEVVIRLARNLEEYMEYSEYSGASPPADSEPTVNASSNADQSGLAQGIEPGHLINTNV